MEWEFPGIMYIYTLCPKCLQSVYNFHAAVYNIILSSKEPKFLQKFNKQNFLVIWTSTYCVLNAYTVSLNSMQRVKRSCAYKLFNAV